MMAGLVFRFGQADRQDKSEYHEKDQKHENGCTVFLYPVSRSQMESLRRAGAVPQIGIKDYAEYKNKGLKRPDRRRTAEKVI